MKCKNCDKTTNSKSGYCIDCILDVGGTINSTITSTKESIRKFYSPRTNTLEKQISIYERLKKNVRTLNDIKEKHFEIVIRCKERLPFIEHANEKLKEIENLVQKKEE